MDKSGGMSGRVTLFQMRDSPSKSGTVRSYGVIVLTQSKACHTSAERTLLDTESEGPTLQHVGREQAFLLSLFRKIMNCKTTNIFRFDEPRMYLADLN